MLPPFVASESDHKTALAPEVVIDLEAANVMAPEAFKSNDPLEPPADVFKFSFTVIAPP